MRCSRPGTVWLLCLAGIVVAVPGAMTDGGDCGPFQSSPAHWSDVLQDDAGSGGDAGDHLAMALHLHREGTADGTLDHPVDLHVADLSDWFTLQLDGKGEHVMANISVEYTEDFVPPPGDVEVSIYPPGAEAPAAVADSRRMNTAIVPDNHVPGAWRFHVQYMDLPAQDECDTQSPGPLPQVLPADAMKLLHSYRVYVGCDPVCVTAEA